MLGAEVPEQQGSALALLGPQCLRSKGKVRCDREKVTPGHGVSLPGSSGRQLF